MRGINQIILIGNLGNDPDVKYMQDGTAVCSLSVATTDKWKDKNSGEEKERTEWHRVRVYGKAAESCGEYLKKGSKVFVQGSVRYSKFTGQDGVEKFYTEVRVDMNGTVQFLDGKPSGERGATSSPRPTSQRRAPADNDEAMARAREDMDPFRDDDIPF